MKTFVIIFAVCIVGIYSFNLECDFKDFNDNPRNKTCKVKNLVITERNQAVTSINGKKELDFDKDFVKTLQVHEQTVNFLPNDIGKMFPELVSVEICHSKLKSICKLDLQQFGKVMNLTLNHNEISSLGSDVFEFTPKLRSVSFNHNSLKLIGEDILKPLKNLQSASFKECNCVDFEALGEDKIPALKKELKEKCPHK